MTRAKATTDQPATSTSAFDEAAQGNLVDAAMAIASRRVVLLLEMKNAILSGNLLFAFECACKLTGISHQQAAKHLAVLASHKTPDCHEAAL